MKNYRKFLAGSLALLLAVGITGCSNTSGGGTGVANEDGLVVLNVASTGQPVSFDPADANLVVNEYTEYDCYDTLLDFNQDGTDVVPALAESWEQVQECLYLEKGELHIFPTAWRQKGEFGSSRYYDYGGNIIGPQQYADWDSFFEGYEKNIVRIYWLWNSTCSVETMLDSYRVFSQGA